MSDRSIEATVRLSYAGLQNDVNAVNDIIKSVTTNLESLGKTNATNGLKTFNNLLSDSTKKLEKFTNLSKESQSFNSFANGLNKIATAMKTLDSVTDLTDASLEKLDTVLDKISQSVIKTYEGIRKLGTEENSVIPNFERFSKILDDLSNKMKYIENHFGKTSSSMKNLDTEVGNSKTQFQQLNNQLNTTNTRLASIDSSSNKTARSLGYLGTSFRNTFSQYVSKAVNSIEQAITETYKAKSEMKSWFEVMGMSSTQIDSFNKKLDETVQQFQRVNKYGMGETIASLGVEFALTEAEMEKAMKTTAMVTNEYLRAGRTSSEANLAIKDILQGQFQRLSRETGVGEKDLIEAGWSGNNTDVMGILNALEKIATSRHWDTIAQKATSINDIFLIGKNRISEGVSDFIDRFTPLLTSSFNQIMVILSDLGKASNRVLDWLSADGLGQSIVKWTGLATAITSVVTALVVYRTGANLTQVAKMGLLRTIVATTLGLEGEAVAEHGLTGAILLSNDAITENTLQKYGRRTAIVQVITGLEAETIAEQGRLKSLIASTFAVEEATFKEKGLRVALLESTAQMEVAKAEAMGLGESMLVLGASIGVPLAIIGAFTGALVLQAMQINATTDAYKKYLNMVENGDDIIAEAKDKVESLTSKKEYLSNQLKGLTEGTYEYNEIASKLKTTEDDLTTATLNYGDAVNSVAWVKHKEDLYNESKAHAQADAQREINQALLDYGFNVQDAHELSSTFWNDAINGWNQHYKTLQEVNYQYSKNAVSVQNALKNLENTQLSDKEVTVLIRRKITTGNNLADAKEELGNATSLTEYVDKWLWLEVRQIENSLADWDINMASGGLDEALDGLGRGVLHFLGDHFVGGMVQELGKGSVFDGALKDFDLDKFISDSFSNLLGGHTFKSDSAWVMDNVVKPYIQPIIDFIQGGGIGQWLSDQLGDWNLWDALMNSIFGQTVSASDGSSDHPSFMEDLSAILGFDVQTWIDNFTSDPLGTLGVEPINIAQILFPQLFGLVEEGTGIATWVDTSIIQPLKNGISQGIASIPILSDIASMLGLVPQQNQNAYITGYNLIDWLKQGVDQKISEIPIISDIARMLGLIPQQNQNAHDKGHGVGDNIKRGEQEGHEGTAKNVGDEMWDIVNKLNDSGLLANVYNSAKAIGQQIWDGVNSVLQRASPGFIHDQVALEFGTDIPNAISESGATAFSVAQEYASQMYGGMNSVNSDFSLGGVVDDYQNDAQIVSEYSQMMGLDTTTAFNSMVLAVNTSTTQMQSDVTTSYDAMQLKQNTLLNNMKTSNTTAYQQMVTQSNTSLNQMRDSTSNVTQQMTNAWIQMKDSIVVTANNLRSETTSHFDALSSNIGSFYRKIQNPSNWGAGSKSLVQKSARQSAGRTISKAFHGAGSRGRKYNGSSTMTVSQLKRNLCPNGDCGSLFDGYDLTDVVDVEAFLRNVEGEHGFGGWSGWNGTHYQYIRNKSNEWDMKSPQIDLVGGIPTSAQFKVGEFETGTPTISFGSFQSMAESIFSAIPYRYYYDSSWQGSWLGALQAGACNCSDGADALIAFARTCGFDGYKKWGTWDGEGHFWAVINGKTMDTTAWQKGYGWTSPKVSGYGTSGRSGSSNANNYNGDLNLTINIYGDEVEVDEHKVDITTAETIIDLVGINPSTGV